MTLHVAMPSRRRGQKLAPSFDEDELTLAWDAVRKADLPAGTKVHAVDLAVPAWFWQGAGLVPDADGPFVLRAVATTLGPSVALHAAGGAAVPDVEVEARRLHAAARERPEPEWQKYRTARDGPDTEADFPLGAYVLPARHEAVTAQRMTLGPAKVASWTTIGAGAAPTEFLRLQDAVGAYHVVMVEHAGGVTVALWAGDGAPTTGQACAPVLRRLFRTQGAWRHGIKFAPVG
ncbi:MAG: hypothetical protein AABY18_05965 [Candidatus Thermoplasmatota archaeon]